MDLRVDDVGRGISWLGRWGGVGWGCRTWSNLAPVAQRLVVTKNDTEHNATLIIYIHIIYIYVHNNIDMHVADVHVNDVLYLCAAMARARGEELVDLPCVVTGAAYLLPRTSHRE